MQNIRGLIAASGLSVTLAACAASTAMAPPRAGDLGSAATAPSSAGQRDLSPEEKKVIIAAVAPSLRDAGSARYRWAKFPTSTTPLDGPVNYCATVDAKSPYAAYDGRQAYIVEVKVVGGKVTAATMGLITGGKDLPLVSKMCAKYELDPNNAS